MTTLPQTTPVRTPRALPTGQLAVPGAGGLAGTQPAVTAGLTGADVWRVIRANVWLILAMIVAAGIIGYVMNIWLSAKHSRFTSTGLISVKTPNDVPNFTSGPGIGSSPQELEVEQRTQARMLVHERLLSSILDSSVKIRETDWFKQFVSFKNGQTVVDAQAAKEDLLDHLDVSPYTNSRLIGVSMSYSIPRDCQTIVEEIVNQHIKNMREAHNIRELDKNNSLEQLELNYEGKIKEIKSRLAKLATDLGKAGVGINGGYSSKDFELQQLISEELNSQKALGVSQTKLRQFNAQVDNNLAPELEEALEKNITYAQYRTIVTETEIQVQEMEASRGKDNPDVKMRKQRLARLTERLSDLELEIKNRNAEMIRNTLRTDTETALEAQKRVTGRLDTIRQEISELSTKRNEFDSLSLELKDVNAKLDHVNDERDKIGYLLSGSKWAQVEWATFPELPDRPTFPKLWVVMSVSIAVGLMLSLGIAFLRELTDNSVRSPRDIARVGHMNLLGMIPHEADDPQSAGARLALAVFEAPHSIIAEQFRQVRTRLQHAASLDTTRSILVTGCGPEDGKSTVAVNLAAGLALNGRRILLVDANFRRPQLHNIFNTDNEVGFGDVLNDLQFFDEAVHETEVPNLSFVANGQRPSNPTELLESQLLIDFIERALEEYDHVIFDSGPLLMVSETVALAPRVDGVVSVVRAQGNSRGQLGRLRDQLRQLKAEHLGVILNAVRVQGGGYYGPMIKTYYAYQNA